MNEKKIKKLFTAARQEPAPVGPPDFAATVLRAVRHEPTAAVFRPFSVLEQLNFWFPRLALAAAVVIVLCAAANYWLPGAEDEVASFSTDQNINVEDL